MYRIYVHIPFCERLCPYCDFTAFAPRAIPEKEYITALLTELKATLRSEPRFSGKVESIYFGGGTPSMFSSEGLSELLSGIIAEIDCSDDIEITCELNPEHGTFEYVSRIVAAGVNRLSCGVQSANDQKLKALGRKHSRASIESLIEVIQRVGLSNWSFDLMFATPEEDISTLRDDLQFYLTAKVPHISTYELTIEPGTPFFTRKAEERLQTPPEDTVAEYMDEIYRILSAADYERYEIASYARNGLHSQHNFGYWKMEPILGLGVGAHSYLPKNSAALSQRWATIRNFREYMSRISTGASVVAWSEEVSQQEQIQEILLVGLRTSEGFSLENLKHQCSKEPMCEFQKVDFVLSELREEGIVAIESDFVRLTQPGMNLYNSVLERLFQVL